MPPKTYEDWMDVATERTADATQLVESRPGSVAAPYIAGYCIECLLKAYLNKQGIKYPRSGQKGHDLQNLWREAGFRKSDINDSTGAKTYFIDLWNTSLRYETELNSNLTAGELIDGAKQLTTWLYTQIRRRRRTRK